MAIPLCQLLFFRADAFPGVWARRQETMSFLLWFGRHARYLSVGARFGARSNRTEISVAEDGKRLTAEWDGDDGDSKSVQKSSYHSVWLRRNCQCPRCLNPQNQSTVLSTELDPAVTLSQAAVSSDGSNLEMNWSCGHQGFLNLDWLRKHCYSSEALEEGRRKISPLFATLEGKMPAMDYKELEDDYGIWKWLKNVNEYGVCLLRGVPCSEEGGLEVSRKICPYLHETFYGGYTELRVEDKPVTISYGPSALEPHMDVPMYESHTGITLIHCLRNDKCVTGGESVIVDGLTVVEKLRKTHPHYFSTLVRVPATFHRINYTWDHPRHMVYRTPHIHLNGHGQVIKFRWAAHHEGPLLVKEEDVEPYYEAYSYLAKTIQSDTECQLHHRLESGDLFTLNNHRMLHGRKMIQLNGGARHLNNLSLNIDEFKSRFHYLCTKYAPDYQPRNVLNNDFSFSQAVGTPAAS